MRFQHKSRLLALMGVAAVLSTGTAAAAPPDDDPQVRLVAASSSVTLDRWDEEGVYLNLGVNVVAGDSPLEIWVERASYADPVVASQVVRRGHRTRKVPLPNGLVKGFAGFDAFTHLTVRDAAGNEVVDRDEDFCPNSYQPVRTRPDAPDTSPYPSGCPTNIFTLGSVWGLQAGWGAQSSNEGAGPVDLADGAYTATVTLNPAYRDLFDVSDSEAAATVAVTVRTQQECRDPDGCLAGKASVRARKPAASGTNPRPAATRPTGKAYAPKGVRPDLRALPAWGIEVVGDEGEGEEGAEPSPQYLAFAATVWTAGSSPLVVDGFRRPGEDVMDAYQYFYDHDGDQVGYAPAGTMEWDARGGHEHWHFTDFAQYRLLDASMQLAVRSGKEAFCLANTDAVDYTLPFANWRPEGTDLHTACGDHSALAVREVLDIGSGDTYAQYLPGQSFDIGDLPNGTYYIEVAANPDHRLYETTTDNNVSLRKVILGGTPGARTVEVPPYDGIEG